MTNRETLWSRAAAAFSTAVVFMTAGCAGGPQRPDFPRDVDPCASYCLVWVPPVYTDVPRVAFQKCGRTKCDTVKVQRTTFEEVCVPARYEDRVVPSTCCKEQEVQVSPAHDEWKRVDCECMKDCWKRERVPAEYKCCERSETNDGFKYCAYYPAERDIVARTKCCDEKRTRYVPAEYRIIWEKQLYSPGHWEWQAKYGCKEQCRPCKMKAPAPTCGCDCRGIPAAD